MFPNQNRTPGASNAQASPKKLKGKGKSMPKRPPPQSAGVKLYGNTPPMGQYGGGGSMSC